MNGETIAAIATASGRAGVAVVRISGPDARAVADRLGARVPEPGRFAVRRLHAAGDPTRALDEAVVLAFAAPRSYTGEDVVELQVHGGAVQPRRVLESCLAAGARLAGRGEFTQRAYLNGRIGYEQAEAVLSVVNSQTDRAADAAMDGLAGRSTSAIRSFYERALEISSTLEHALDVSEEELPPGFVSTEAAKAQALAEDIRGELRRLGEGRLLREGALVVLAGSPNAGKSSLLNALLGERRAIVSDVPGTTRDSIEESIDIEGWPIRLTDTAGLRKANDAIEDEGIRRSEDLISRAEIVIYLSAEDVPTAPDEISRETILVHSKSDLREVPSSDWLEVSAVTGAGIDALKAEIVRRLERIAAEGCDDSVRAARLNEILSLLPLGLTPWKKNVENFVSENEDIVLLANRLRLVSENLGAFIGATYSEDMLSRLFSRFCVGK